MNSVILGSILSIVNESFRFFNEKQRTRFIDEHYKILVKLNKAKNTSMKDYSDSEKDLMLMELETFLIAFESELKRVKI